MSVFKPEDRVGVLCDGEIRKGTIKKVYGQLNTAIVHFDDGNVEKVHLSHLGKLSEEKNQEPKEPTEPVEKSEITITPKEFRNCCVNVLIEETEDLPITVSMAFLKFCSVLHNALFVEGEDD